MARATGRRKARGRVGPARDDRLTSVADRAARVADRAPRVADRVARVADRAARVVHVADRQRRLRIPRPEVRALVRRALAGVPHPGEVSIVFVADGEMRALNRDYHAQDRTTDVLSFPMADPRRPGPGDAGELLAEVVVCTDRAAAEAARRRLPVRRELLLYVVHGCLHIAGFDDHRTADRRAMRRREREVLAAR